jgi:hypothetical protein
MTPRQKLWLIALSLVILVAAWLAGSSHVAIDWSLLHCAVCHL